MVFTVYGAGPEEESAEIQRFVAEFTRTLSQDGHAVITPHLAGTVSRAVKDKGGYQIDPLDKGFDPCVLDPLASMSLAQDVGDAGRLRAEDAYAHCIPLAMADGVLILDGPDRLPFCLVSLCAQTGQGAPVVYVLQEGSEPPPELAPHLISVSLGLWSLDMYDGAHVAQQMMNEAALPPKP